MIALSISLGVGNGAAKTAPGPLTPPTVAPVLIVSADYGSYIAVLEWTPSNKTSSPGFYYEVWREGPAGGWNLVGSYNSSILTVSIDEEPSGMGIYRYYVKPINDAGEGPSSNTVEIPLPGT